MIAEQAGVNVEDVVDFECKRASFAMYSLVMPDLEPRVDLILLANE